MSTAAASAPEARDLTSWLVQDQEPQEPSDQAAPSDERGREGSSNQLPRPTEIISVRLALWL